MSPKTIQKKTKSQSRQHRPTQTNQRADKPKHAALETVAASENSTETELYKNIMGMLLRKTKSMRPSPTRICARLRPTNSSPPGPSSASPSATSPRRANPNPISPNSFNPSSARPDGLVPPMGGPINAPINDPNSNPISAPISDPNSDPNSDPIRDPISDPISVPIYAD